MREEIPVIPLTGAPLSRSVLDEMCGLLDSMELWAIQRGYFFMTEGGFSFDEAASREPRIKELSAVIESELSRAKLLKEMRVIERGIARVPVGKRFYLRRAINRLTLDIEGRHVRIPLRGFTKINKKVLEVGTAYVIDNIKPFYIEVDSSMHLVYTFLPNTDTRKIWSLWRIPGHVLPRES